jgi:EAL domain-containing protein (putative c-di-GMP-specific phosphodiesterase class I)
MDVSVQAPSPVADLLASTGLRMLFQPILELESGDVVGFEALARGPLGSDLERPGDLFAAAAREGILPELDRACRGIAVEEAVAADLDPSQLLFVNAEPAGLDHGGVLDRLAERGLERISIVVELTERALTSRPSEVLSAVRWLRERGCRIALDDVGVDERSLALMPFLFPDLIKLDMRVVQNQLPPLDAARVLNAVGAEAERSGAVIVAEGIETAEHLGRAEAMGATLGQGWLLGPPAPLPLDSPPSGAPDLPARTPASGSQGTPFELISGSRRVRRGGRGDKRLLTALARQLEGEAMTLAGEVVVISTFQDRRFFDPATRRRYERIAQRAALVGAVGVGMGVAPGVGVRGADLEPEDALRDEWNVIVISPHFSGAFVARDLGDDGRDIERRFDYFLTYDRELVADSATRLLPRIVPVI